MEGEKQAPLCAPDAALVGYTFVRHIGLILDELSSQGLDLWRDEHARWHWRWLMLSADQILHSDVVYCHWPICELPRYAASTFPSRTQPYGIANRLPPDRGSIL
jgi:hypothetical protein